MSVVLHSRIIVTNTFLFSSRFREQPSQGSVGDLLGITRGSHGFPGASLGHPGGSLGDVLVIPWESMEDSGPVDPQGIPGGTQGTL